MKRILTLFIACVLLLSCFSFHTFADNAKNLLFEVSVDGENEIIVEAGNKITVDFTIENISDDAGYTITNLQNEIEFDDEFFEFTEGDVEFVTAKSSRLAEYSWGAKRVQILALHVDGDKAKAYEDRQLVARVTFKVKEGLADGSSSTLVNKVCEAADGISGVTYTTSSQNMTVYIGKTPTEKYTLTYKNGNTVVNTDNSAALNSTVKIYSAPTVTDKKFAGWKDTDGKLWQPGDTYTVTKDMTFTAVWLSKYTLSFNTNGGTKISDKIAWEDETINLAEFTTTRSGYTFDGWYEDAGFKNPVTSIKLSDNTTIYAKWSKNGGGTVTPVTPAPDDDKEENTNYKPAIMTDEHYAYIMGREDGKIYPQANLTRAEAATIFFRLLKEDVRDKYLTKENNFRDVDGTAWYNTAVSTLANLGLINGRTSDTFAPNASITRAELTTIVARLSDAEYNGNNLFSDISGHWAQKYINLAASINWVNGENGKFRPDDNITRAEVMTLINRVLNRQPETTADLLDGMKIWPDNSDPNVWYYIAIQEATNSHDYKIKPDGIHETWTKLIEDPDWSDIEN